jgi:hypothetical protein
MEKIQEVVVGIKSAQERFDEISAQCLKEGRGLTKEELALLDEAIQEWIREPPSPFAPVKKIIKRMKINKK